ncbi:hypothetical protein XAPC_3254 [Xanthomonas citri pv. punicae str. LMG 859]|nr:hypothetical protein XAPC_3254 [Xanthomonas citri pv. punicae str. LMG 859]
MRWLRAESAHPTDPGVVAVRKQRQVNAPARLTACLAGNKKRQSLARPAFLATLRLQTD